jgi:hypothetical protein
LPGAALEKLEALASFEAADLFDAAGATSTSANLLARVGQMAP